MYIDALISYFIVIFTARIYIYCVDICFYVLIEHSILCTNVLQARSNCEICYGE